MHPEIFKKLVSLTVLAAGIVLIVYGVSASDSFASDFSRVITGSPTDKSLWLLIGGVAAAAIGASGLLRRAKTP